MQCWQRIRNKSANWLSLTMTWMVKQKICSSQLTIQKSTRPLWNHISLSESQQRYEHYLGRTDTAFILLKYWRCYPSICFSQTCVVQPGAFMGWSNELFTACDFVVQIVSYLHTNNMNWHLVTFFFRFFHTFKKLIKKKQNTDKKKKNERKSIPVHLCAFNQTTEL